MGYGVWGKLFLEVSLGGFGRCGHHGHEFARFGNQEGEIRLWDEVGRQQKIEPVV